MIEIDALTKDYLDLTVVDHVSMTVADGDLAVIVGTSGSGKTTLLRMINRLIEPTSGSVRIDGRDTRAVPPHLLRREIGYAIQGHGLFPHRTVGQNIATVPVLMGWDKARIERRVEELLELFQLPADQFRDRLPAELSGGQQQRVGVARALAAEPKLLLMDEPFGALDPIIRAKAQADLLDVQKRFGTTIVLVTHDMEEAIHLGSKIAVMDKGKLLQFATPAEIVVSPATEFVGELLGSGDRAFRLLGLQRIGDFVEPGAADGHPVTTEQTLRDGLEEALWSGRSAVPVVDAAGTPVGRLTLAALEKHGARPR
ncbi:MAG: ABC transporter ATP-binding protein [Devosia sp.]